MASDPELGLAVFIAKIDLVILCNSFSQKTREDLAARMRKFAPDVAIIEFGSGLHLRNVDGGRRQGVDGLWGPEEFLDTVKNLFRDK